MSQNRPKTLTLKNWTFEFFRSKYVQVNLCLKLFLFAEYGENMLCTKIDLNVRNNFCAQTFFKIIICFKCWFWKGESNNCNMLSWMNPCYLQFICNLTEFVSHIVTPGSLKRVVEKYAKRCALESVQKWSFQLFY